MCVFSNWQALNTVVFIQQTPVLVAVSVMMSDDFFSRMGNESQEFAERNLHRQGHQVNLPTCLTVCEVYLTLPARNEDARPTLTGNSLK